MKVAHRLYLASVPAVLGVFAVAGLAYWGQYERAIPELVLAITAVASVGTLIMAWINVRYVAQRVERLAGPEGLASAAVSLRGVASAIAPGHTRTSRDELDTIETVVARLSTAVEQAETSRVERERTFEERARDYAQMLSSVTGSAIQRLEEVRLPLHILLENHFGDLNENQEELLGAARAAAEATDADLLALQQIADLDLGTRAHRNDRLLPGDVVRAILPTLKAAAEIAGSTLNAELEPLVPAIHGDQVQLQDALSTLLGEALTAMSPGTVASLSLSRVGAGAQTGTQTGAQIELLGAGQPTASIRVALACRIIEANDGAITRTVERLSIVLQ